MHRSRRRRFRTLAWLGVALVCLWGAPLFGDERPLLKLSVLQFGTAPLAGHVMGRAAYRSGVPLWRGTIVDDLAHVREHRRDG